MLDYIYMQYLCFGTHIKPLKVPFAIVL